jgi:hypothetical protein
VEQIEHCIAKIRPLSKTLMPLLSMCVKALHDLIGRSDQI